MSKGWKFATFDLPIWFLAYLAPLLLQLGIFPRRNVVAAEDDDRRAQNEERGGDGAAGGRRRGDGDGFGDDGTNRQTREELSGLASRLKLARAHLVSAEQRWNGLVERAEF